MPPGVLSESQVKSNQERVLQDIRDHRFFSNLVIITHDLNISNIVLEPSIAMGDFFVLQPNGTDFDVIGKIRMGEPVLTAATERGLTLRRVRSGLASQVIVSCGLAEPRG
jgi:hypothetical protein